MSISAECNVCGRKYQAPAGMAGKRVRCKQCGNVFQLPGSDSAAGGNEVDPLAELEKSFGSAAAMDTTTITSPVAAAEDNGGGISIAPLRTGRMNVRFAFPYAKEIDTWTPLVLIVGGLAWLASQAFGRDDAGPVWLAAVRLAVALLTYVLFVAPLTLSMIRRAGKAMGYQMPSTDRRRTFAAFLPGFALAYVMWLAGGGGLLALALGCLAGVTISAGPLWLLFRLHPDEIAPTAARAGAGFFIGVAIAGAIFFGLNALLIQVMVSTKKPDALPGSPFGQAFGWITQSQKDKIREEIERSTPKPKPPPTVVEATPVEPTPPPAPQVPQVGSRMVQRVALAGVQGPFDEVVYPLTPSQYAAIIRPPEAGRITVEVWDTGTWARSGSATFPIASDPNGNRFVLSPDGQELARIASFPRLSVQVWSFAQSRVSRSVYLDERLGAPELVGFAGEGRLLLRWGRDAFGGLQLNNTRTAEMPRHIETDPFDRKGVTLAVSPDGSLAAITAKSDQSPILQVHDLDSGKLLGSLPITALDPHYPVTPTGFAFSPDSGQVAVLFEHGGSGLLVAYRIDRSRGTVSQTAEYVYPAGPLGGWDTSQYAGNAVAWLPGGRSWLVYGHGVVEAASGRLAEEIDLAGVESCRVRGADMLEMVTQNPLGSPRQIILLQLDPARIPGN